MHPIRSLPNRLQTIYQNTVDVIIANTNGVIRAAMTHPHMCTHTYALNKQQQRRPLELCRLHLCQLNHNTMGCACDDASELMTTVRRGTLAHMCVYICNAGMWAMCEQRVCLLNKHRGHAIYYWTSRTDNYVECLYLYTYSLAHMPPQLGDRSRCVESSAQSSLAGHSDCKNRRSSRSHGSELGGAPRSLVVHCVSISTVARVSVLCVWTKSKKPREHACGPGSKCRHNYRRLQPWPFGRFACACQTGPFYHLTGAVSLHSSERACVACSSNRRDHVFVVFADALHREYIVAVIWIGHYEEFMSFAY